MYCFYCVEFFIHAVFPKKSDDADDTLLPFTHSLRVVFGNPCLGLCEIGYHSLVVVLLHAYFKQMKYARICLLARTRTRISYTHISSLCDNLRCTCSRITLSSANRMIIYTHITFEHRTNKPHYTSLVTLTQDGYIYIFSTALLYYYTYYICLSFGPNKWVCYAAL